MSRRYLALILAAAVLAAALSACGSSSGGSTSAHAEATTTELASESEAAAESEVPSESEATAEESGGASELESIMRLQIYGRYGGTPTEFDVAGGACRIVKINTTKAAIKAGGEAVLDHEHNASVLVTPIKHPGETPTAAECHEAVAIAIG
jgi:hypothetical protein